MCIWKSNYIMINKSKCRTWVGLSIIHKVTIMFISIRSHLLLSPSKLPFEVEDRKVKMLSQSIFLVKILPQNLLHQLALYIYFKVNHSWKFSILLCQSWYWLIRVPAERVLISPNRLVGFFMWAWQILSSIYVTMEPLFFGCLTRKSSSVMFSFILF